MNATTDECGYSPLHLGAEHGDTAFVRLLLKSGAQVDYRPDTSEEFPENTLCDEPLRLAIRNKHKDIARLLLEHGADPNKRYFFGSEINLVSDLEFLELLLTFGANPDSKDRSGLNPLMKAVKQRNNMEVIVLLLKHGADVNAITDQRHDYRTVLHYAVVSGNINIIDLMIKQGAKPNYDKDFDLKKPSPLDLAILKGDPNIVELLIRSGADVNCSSPIIGSPLHVACAEGIPNRYDILTLLLEAGADPNLKVFTDDFDYSSQLRPVLVEYIASNERLNMAIVKMLITYGSRVIMKTQFRDPDGMLNYLKNVASNENIFFILLEACEAFDPCLIRRNQVMSPKQKTKLLELSKYPLTLKKQIRLYMRKLIGSKLLHSANGFDIPHCLKKYLLFDYS
ncbi:unnamed protein product [Ceutorhynchus assimilis]|uniref:SOCS box domain-containing protein n=1 Tax=Ceutorhynchus assimilis TaxID=467358 RepID=A0A9N9MTQ8_9CUCU|nr:unnamed protein product [Ceutorhynchus assimilis]